MENSKKFIRLPLFRAATVSIVFFMVFLSISLINVKSTFAYNDCCNSVAPNYNQCSYGPDPYANSMNFRSYLNCVCGGSCYSASYDFAKAHEWIMDRAVRLAMNKADGFAKFFPFDEYLPYTFLGVRDADRMGSICHWWFFDSFDYPCDTLHHYGNHTGCINTEGDTCVAEAGGFDARNYAQELYTLALRFWPEGGNLLPSLNDLWHTWAGEIYPGPIPGITDLCHASVGGYPQCELYYSDLYDKDCDSPEVQAACPRWPDFASNDPEGKQTTPTIERAMIYLGWASHMIQEMTVPWHAYNNAEREHQQYEDLIDNIINNEICPGLGDDLKPFDHLPLTLTDNYRWPSKGWSSPTPEPIGDLYDFNKTVYDYATEARDLTIAAVECCPEEIVCWGDPYDPDVFPIDYLVDLAIKETAAVIEKFAHEVDKVAPVTTLDSSTPKGWQRVDFDFVANAQDNIYGSGVKQMTYSVYQAQNIPPTTVPGSYVNLRINIEGISDIFVYAEDNVGNIAYGNLFQAMLDKTQPYIYGVQWSQYPNSNGWNNQPLTIQFQCNDDLSGVGSTNNPLTLQQEGAYQQVTASCFDLAGNNISKTIGPINIDLTPPVPSLPSNVSTTATGSQGATVSYNFSATDSLSGVDTSSCSPTSGSVFPLGLTTVLCSATDKAGNTAQGSFTVNVTYSWSSFLVPKPNSYYYKGSTVPVKFQLTGASATITNAVARLFYAPVKNGVVGSYVPAVSADKATTDSLFRYDPLKNQYIFNWSTKGLATGIYRLKIDMGDGVNRTIQVSLK